MTIIIHMPNSKGQKFQVDRVTSMEVTRIKEDQFMIQYMLDDNSGKWHVATSEHPHIDVR